MKLSGDMAQLVAFDQLENKAQELSGSAMLLELVQLFQELCRSVEDRKTRQKSRPGVEGGALQYGVGTRRQAGKDKRETREADGGASAECKGRQRKERAHEVEDPTLEKKKPMKQATDVISRIIWDPDLPTELFTVGYLDRFVGVIEKPFGAFSWEDIASVDYSTLAVPKHRIQYFKYRDQIVWDKTTQTDDVFGSRGSGKTITEVMEEYDSKQPRSNPHDSDHEDMKDMKAPDTESEDENEEEEKDKKKRCIVHRPTHFVCIPITSPQIRAAAQDVQEALCCADPRLRDGCLLVSALHVTLAMIRINTDKDLQSVRGILTDLQLQFVSLFNLETELLFDTVNHFRDRVIHTRPRPQPALTRFVTLLMQKLSEAGIPTPGNYSEYQPHVTLVKLSRPMCRQFEMTSIDRSLYSAFADRMFGRQHVECFHLCSISGPKEDGFYQCLHTVENNIVSVSPSIPRLIQSACEKAVVNEILSEKMAEMLMEAILKQTAVEQRELLQQLATALQSLKDRPTLVILRGLPGSGKSTVAHAITADDDSICSADDFFKKEQGYSYDQTKLTVAHNRCFLRCVELMMSGTDPIVVDNTNSQLWVYSAYKELSRVAGYRVQVLELLCPDQLTLGRYAHRSIHNVPVDACVKMAKQWEKDPMAVTVTQEQIKDPIGLIDILHHSFETNNTEENDVIIYTGIYLTKQSRERLLQLVPPIHETIVCDHMTLQFNPEPDQVDISAIGKEVLLHVLGVASDPKIQAVVVEPLSESVTSGNALPHITVSYAQGVKPSYANDMLQNRVRPLDMVVSDITLSGIVGAEVGPRHGQSSRHVVNGSELSAVLHQQWLNEKMWPQRTDIPTCQLFVFDFDGTLVESPDPVQGRREYKRLTGEDWPHKRFLGTSESLSDPFTVLAGPAMADFRCHSDRAGSLCVVLTARITSVEPAVKMLLERYNMYPDRLISKPDGCSQTSAEFKTDVLKTLLNEFPSVRSIKLWDDSDDNLKAFQTLSRQCPAINFAITDSKSMTTSHEKSEVAHFLHQTGILPHPSFAAACHSAISYVSEAWQSIIKVPTSDPTKLAFPFGSSQLGRFADVDVCLLAPNTLSQKECVLKLERELRDRGVTFTYISHSSRCPRLKAKCFFAAASPVELDVVFCLVPRLLLDSLHSSPRPSLDIITASLAKSDRASHTALTGPAFLQDLLAAVSKSGRSLLDCVCLVEMLCLILKSSHLKGNAFHCIRTFHLLKLVQYFLQAEPKAKSLTLDELQIKFIEFCSAYSTAQWSKLFGEFVPSDYITPLCQTFVTTERLVQPVISRDILYRLATASSTASRHSQLELTFSSPDPVHEWRLGIFVEARLGSYIRLLLSGDMTVYPGHVKPTAVAFMVPDSRQAVHTVRQVLAPFWDELVDFSRKAPSVLLISMHSPTTSQTTVLFSHGNIGLILQFVKEFASGRHGLSLHLPSLLGKYERLQVHELAGQMGLEHSSFGEGKDRNMILTRKEGKL